MFTKSSISRSLNHFITVVCCCITICSCTSNERNIQLVFSLDASQTEPEVDVSFYLSSIRLFTADEVVPLILLPNDWQNDSVALVHLSSKQKEFSKATVQGLINANLNLKAIEFDIGLPFELNHAYPLQAQAPLNYSPMFWSWQQGYKFLRIDAKSQKQSWVFHLGSEGCRSSSMMRPPQEACERVNKVTYRLNLDGEQAVSEINMHISLDELMKIPAGDVDGDVDVFCTGKYQDNPQCREIFSRLGMDVDTGRCLNQCEDQKWLYVK